MKSRKQIYDQSDATAKANAAAVESARADVAAAEQQVTQAQSRVAQAQAALAYSHTGPQQVEATRARARAAARAGAAKEGGARSGRTERAVLHVVAPVSGVVSKNVEVGMNVQPGQTLVSIVPLDDVWITANFKETQLAQMRPGQRVTISVDAFSREYHGNVDSIAGASGARFSLLPPENATGNYVKVVQRVPVKIVLDPGENKDHLLRLGMSVVPKVWVQMSEAAAAALPAERGVRAPGRQSVDHRADRDARDVHGGAGHQHRQRLAAAHCRRPLGRRR